MKDKVQPGPLFPRGADARYGQLVVAPGEDGEGGPGAAPGGGGPLGRGTTRGGVTRRRAGPLVICNAARERTRVKTLRTAFHDLQQALPCVPPNTKLSKLDVLVLATMYIAHLMGTLRREALGDGEGQRGRMGGAGRPWCPEYFHPVKKWPMRTRLYAGLAARARGNPTSPDPHSDMPRDLSSFV